MKKLAIASGFVIMLASLSGCGGDSAVDIDNDDLPNTEIKSFSVYGNDVPVNDREQIVAGLNDGLFQVDIDIARDYSNDAKVLVSDKKDINSTDLEQEIVHFRCDNYPSCSFDIVVNCTYSASNHVLCSLESGGDGRFTENFPEVDMTPLMNGTPTDLYIILVADIKKLKPAQQTELVTFRLN